MHESILNAHSVVLNVKGSRMLGALFTTSGWTAYSSAVGCGSHAVFIWDLRVALTC